MGEQELGAASGDDADTATAISETRTASISRRTKRPSTPSG
jgi:hypothetical protein